jgi:ABC-2 type transport system permease protein
MLGGTMWPLEVVGDTMRTIGHLVPQAWIMDGFVTLIFDGGGVTDLGRELAVLASFALVALVLGARRLDRRLAG